MFHAWATGAVRRKRRWAEFIDHRKKGFTLFEMMAAIAVLALVFTAVTVSLRGKWRAEEARRGAQRLALAWMKARSHAWREGREWSVSWDSQRGKILGSPADRPEGDGDPEQASEAKSRSFEFEVGKGVRLSGPEKEETLAPVRFLPNGRVTPALVVVSAPGRPSWQVRMDWDGRPALGLVEEAREGHAPSRRPTLSGSKTSEASPPLAEEP